MSGGHKQSFLMQSPRIMIEQKFLSLVQQAAKNPNPVSVKLMRKVPIYDNFDGKWIERENSILFMNLAYERNISTKQ